MEIIVEKLPENAEEMKQMDIFDLREPANTAALTVMALSRYPEDPAASIEMLDLLRGPRPLSAYEKQFLRDRFMDCSYVMASYFKGASPENDYVPDLPYALTFSESLHSRDQEGYLKLFIRSSGADTERYVVLRHRPSSGEWFLWEQYLTVGIRMKKSQDSWA